MEQPEIEAPKALIPYVPPKGHSTLVLVAVAFGSFFMGFVFAAIIGIVLYIVVPKTKVALTNQPSQKVVYLYRPAPDVVKPVVASPQTEKNPPPPMTTGVPTNKTAEEPNIGERHDVFSSSVDVAPPIVSRVSPKYMEVAPPPESPSPTKQKSTPTTVVPSMDKETNTMAAPPGVDLLRQQTQ